MVSMKLILWCAVDMESVSDLTNVTVPPMSGLEPTARIQCASVLHQPIKGFAQSVVYAQMRMCVNVSLIGQVPTVSYTFVLETMKQTQLFVVVTVCARWTDVIALMVGQETIVQIRSVSDFHSTIGTHVLE